jgi:type IV pilus assembly protein PilB
MANDRLLIGEILLKRKIITKEQLDHALEAQKKEGGFVGEILVKLKYLEERDIVVALVVQCGLPYIAVNKYAIDPAIVGLIPKETALAERLIALDKIGDILSVVMTNPLSDERKAKLEALTKCRVATFISTKSEIEDAIARNYN